nr:T9SS type A sorting domain-containing protein [Chitinophagaceae bacterium]
MKTPIIFFTFFSLIFHYFANSQNLSGKRWILGGAKGVEVVFNDTSRPTVRVVYGGASPYYFAGGHSVICDSVTGKLLFSCNGMVLYDSAGNIMNNGDHLVDWEYYHYNAFPISGYTQSSLVLPKGNNGLFYVFVATVSDSMFNIYWNAQSPQAPFDRLQYNIVDMNANGGLGSVIIKNKLILQGVAIHKTMMQACRHSNGIDWWLLKQGEYDTNRIYRFLVKVDTIEGPWIQNFEQPKYPAMDLAGQYAFNKEGTKFASIQGQGHMNKLFLADFDRCTGELNNPKVINIPIDSTTNPMLDNAGSLDSVNSGVCFSPNGQFLYISKWWNIYQYEFLEADSALAWYNVKHGPDTTLQKFQYYGKLGLGFDNRIYIGNYGGTAKQSSVIDKPDIKGVGCQFCRKCFRLDSAVIFAVTSPPNMPDYNLGPSGQVCWPLGSSEIGDKRSEMEVWPNPASTRLYIKTESKEKRELYNSVGQLLFTTKENEIGVSRYASGVYYLKCGNMVVKISIE